MFRNGDKTVLEFWKETMGARTGQYGVELELEGMGLTHPISGWEVKAEGSLRDGLEYIFRNPVHKEAIPGKMHILNKSFEAAGTVLRNSHRTSTHIHLNVQQEPLYNVFGVIVVYLIIEAIFLRLCGEPRNGNHFCMPAYDTDGFREWTRGTINAIKQGWTRLNQRGKYSSLNVDPIQSFGSIEFRCFPATISSTDIMLWVTWIDNIYQLVKNCEDKTFMSILNEASRNPEKIVNDIFQDHSLHARMPEIPEMVMMGCELAHEVVHVLISEDRIHKMEKDKPVTAKPQRFPKSRIADWDALGE